MRIVHVIDSLSPAGGAENRLVDEVVELADRHEQVVVHLFTAGDLAHRLVDAGVPVMSLGHRAPHAGRTWPWLSMRLTRELRQLRPDVLHTSLFTGNLVGQLAGARAGVPVVSTFNRTGDLTLQRTLQAGVASLRGRLMQRIGRWAARRGDVHYRAVSAYALTTNCRLMGWPTDRATVVPRGIRVTPGDRQADRAAFGIPDGPPLFANVARRVPEKAQHLLVDAFARVRKDLPDARLAIAGAPGPADAAIREAVTAASLDDAVHLLGHRPDARRLVSSADVFTFSSLSEGSPGAVVEALLLGTPVAAFDIPPVAELTDHGRHARLAAVGSADDLGRAMLDAYLDPDRDARVDGGRRWARRYEQAEIARRLDDLLTERANGAQT